MKRGFSLVELSIVLVILGLLVGGVLSGQSLIRAAEMRTITTGFQRYQAASQSFRDKYFSIPGDFNNATAFWGTAAICSGSGTTTPGSCNGNGDGHIDTPTAAGLTGEMFQYWRQLALAGLIEGTYTGVAGPSGAGHAIPGTNVPAGRMSNTGFSPSYYVAPGDSANYALNYGNQVTFGGANTIDTTGAILTPAEVWNIDTKLDDGKPGTGSIIGVYWSACTTSASFSDTTGAYLLSGTSLCAIRFRNFI